REASDEQNHRNRAANKCEWSSGPKSFCNRCRNHENSCTNCRAVNVGSQSWNSDAADQLMIDALRLLDRERRMIGHRCILGDSVVYGKCASLAWRASGCSAR